MLLHARRKGQVVVVFNPESLAGQIIGQGRFRGQCAALVQHCGCPHSTTWTAGPKVKDAVVEKGSCIATFENGIYPGLAHDNHCAIYISKNDEGILVWDQWTGKPVSQRRIAYLGGTEDPSNNGDCLYVIHSPR